MLDEPPEFDVSQSEPILPRMIILFDKPKRNERCKKIESRGFVKRRRLTDLSQTHTLRAARRDYIDDRAGACQCLNARGFRGC